jgi:signal transduction histidine kinase/tetratricopeptide (TPR) repeat protein
MKGVIQPNFRKSLVTMSIWCFFTVALDCMGQSAHKIDSLRALIGSYNEKTYDIANTRSVLNNHLELASLLMDVSADSVNLLLESCRKIAVKNEFSDFLAECDYINGIFLQRIEHYKESNECFVKYRDYFQGRMKSDPEANRGLISANVSIANNYTYMGNYADAIRLHLDVLQWHIGKKMEWEMGLDYTNIAMIYSYQGDFEKMIEYSDLSIALGLKYDDKLGLATNYSNLVGSYAQLGRLNEALEVSKKGLELYRELGNKRDIARSLNGMASVYKQLEDYDSSLKCLEEYIEVLGDLEVNSSSLIVYSNLASCYRHVGKNDQALEYIQKTLFLLNDDTEPTIKRKIYFEASAFFEAEGNFSEALHYRKLRDKVNDQINDKEVTRKLAMSEATFQYKIKENELNAAHEKLLWNEEQKVKLMRLRNDRILSMALVADKEKEIALSESGKLDAQLKYQQVLNENTLMSNDNLTKENAYKSLLNKRQQSQTYWAYTAIFALLLLGGFSLYSFIKKNKLSNKLAQSIDVLKDTQHKLILAEREKEAQNIRLRISRDIHDEIGSTLTKVALLSDISRQHDNINSVRVGESLLKIGNYARSLNSSLGEIVWAISPHHDNLSETLLFMRNYIHNFLEDASLDYCIDFTDNYPDKTVNAEVRTCLLMVLKEALNNVLKHSDATRVRVAFEVIDDHYKMAIEDNGSGLTINDEKKFGNGLVNMQERVALVNGKLEVVTSAGCGVKLFVSGSLNVLQEANKAAIF